MKPTIAEIIGDIIGGVCIVALPFLLIIIAHGVGL